MTKDQAIASALKNRARGGYSTETGLSVLQADIARYSNIDNLARAFLHHGFALSSWTASVLAKALYAE